MDVAVLVSPAAGPRPPDARALGGAVLDVLRRARVGPHRPTCCRRPGARPSGQAADAVVRASVAVVAVGGDGSVHAALQAVGRRPPRWPWSRPGTGNDLARALGIPRSPWRPPGRPPRTCSPAARELDVGRTGGRWWATVLCCGFDSAVSDRANRLRWPRGRRRYDVAILAELARLRPREVTLVLDGEPVQPAGHPGRRR